MRLGHRISVNFDFLVQKALTYFRDGDLATLDAATQALLVREAGIDLEVSALPLLAPTIG